MTKRNRKGVWTREIEKVLQRFDDVKTFCPRRQVVPRDILSPVFLVANRCRVPRWTITPHFFVGFLLFTTRHFVIHTKCFLGQESVSVNYMNSLAHFISASRERNNSSNTSECSSMSFSSNLSEITLTRFSLSCDERGDLFAFYQDRPRVSRRLANRLSVSISNK